MTNEPPMYWPNEGEKFEPSVRNVGNECLRIAKGGDKEEAQHFLSAYAKWQEECGVENPMEVAKQNIGYILGYYDPDSRKVVYEVFEVGHPILPI